MQWGARDGDDEAARHAAGAPRVQAPVDADRRRVQGEAADRELGELSAILGQLNQHMQSAETAESL